jgi:hypothetical protein
MNEDQSKTVPMGQPWLVGMYHNRLNPMEHKISLRTCFEKKELQALIEQASAAVPPPEGREGEYVPTTYTSEVRLPLGPGMVLPIEISLEVYDEDKVKLNQTLYGYARSQVEGKGESPIIKP